MFFAYLVAAARAQNIVLPSARDRYLAFNFYPVADLARLVLEAAPLLFPERSLRHALRTLGRGGPDALLTTSARSRECSGSRGPADRSGSPAAGPHRRTSS